jgi:oligopeptide/dipeptide ABC transporter ATP-binding protein
VSDVAATEVAANVLEVRDLVVEFAGRGKDRRRAKVRAVDGVSFDIGHGEILALVGESGCGKSTIALSVMRLIEATSGVITFAGHNLTDLHGRPLRAIRHRIQMIFQDPFSSLDPRQTVFQTVVEPLVIAGIADSAPERSQLVMDALDLAHLRPPERLAQSYSHALSGGQRQRVAIASAMVMKPDLVVADEPISMLDVSARAGILRLMMDLRDRLGCSYLFITHDLAVAWMVADRIAVLYLGRVVEIGPAEVLVTHAAHPYTKALLEVARGDDEPPESRVGERAPVLQGETPSAARIPTGCRFHPRCPRYAALGEPEICRSDDPHLRIASQVEHQTRVHEAACHFIEEQNQ